MAPTPAPGARVLIRNEEWVIRNVEPCDVGGHQLDCIWLSETVRNRDAIFLTELDEVRVLDPGETDLVADDSPGFIATLLYLEARLRQTVPTDTAISTGHRGAMDLLPFQLDPTRHALEQLRPRFLIADSVGLGKTLEAGILVSELIRRGRGRRILVVSTKSMIRQFQQEFWSRFTVPLTRLDSAGIQRIRRQLPSNHNPFHYYDRTIISIDTLKKDTEYRHYLEQAHWDIVVIDEAHNVSFKGGTTALRNRLANLLATRADALVLLTATPHSGDRESFASLMRMLDPTVLPRGVDYTREDIEHLFVRRFKGDVREQIKASFPERQVFRFAARPCDAEEQAFARLAELELHIDEGARGRGEMLFRTTLEKALLSSPAACAKSVEERLRKLRGQDAAHPDIASLGILLEAVAAVRPEEVGKLGDLVTRLTAPGTWQWNPADAEDRLVIFTERIETLKFLREQLPQRLGLPDKAVATLHGQNSDKEVQDIVEGFGKSNSPLRLLIASDVASEGINLHYCAHRLVHWDIPWSLMVFQQRNGRVDRYGQENAPLIAYMFVDTAVPRIKGDQRILEILVRKDEQAARNIGDPSIFMGLYDEDAEVQRVVEAMQGGESAEDFDAALGGEGEIADWLLEMMQQGAGPTAVDASPPFEPFSLFADDLAWLRAGIEHLHALGQFSQPPQHDADTRSLTVRPNADLERVLRIELDAEMRPDDGQYVLSADRNTVKRAMERARGTDQWTRIQLLWPLHPVLRWLEYKLLAGFGRHAAPVIRVPRGVEAGEAVVLVSGLIPNRRGQTVLNEWLAVRVAAEGSVRGSGTLAELVAATGLGREPFPNSGKPFDKSALGAALKPALEHAERHMAALQREHSTLMRIRSAQEMDRLAALRDQHHQQLELQLGGEASVGLAAANEARRQGKAREVDVLFDSYRRWASDTLELDPRAHLTVCAVFVA
ncbi:MAG: DEAD/DEAH box helicase [Gammaproteobacteria bacterium]|nr:DEAD/DEAH box helicase [Gammaproteobacteria bacterium]